MTNDPVLDFVGSKIARYEKVIVHAPDRRGRMRKRTSYRQTKAGWTPFDALNWAKDRDKIETFRLSVMLVRLCDDVIARAEPVHKLIHQVCGITACVGPDLVVATAESLGISDERARYLVAQLDAEYAAFEGLSGSGER